MFLVKLAIGVVLSLIAATGHACVLNIVYSDVASPPYFLGDGEAIPEPPGMAVELVTLAAAKLDCRVNWQRLPNRRVQHSVEQGSADAMLMFSYNEERSAYAVYPKKNGVLDPALRLAELTYSVYVKDGSTVTWDGKRFGNVQGSVGANAGYSVVKEIGNLGVTVVEAPGTLNNLKKLQLGRIDAFVSQDLQTDAVIARMKLVDISKLSPPFSTKDYYLPFAKRFFGESPVLALGLWSKISEVRKEKGKELLRKYFEME